jgi:hypothetical protein
MIERDFIVEKDHEWLKIAIPSLKGLNGDLRSLNGQFVKIKLVPTGSKFIGRDGEEKEKTVIQFMAFYPDRESALAAAGYSSDEDRHDGNGHNGNGSNGNGNNGNGHRPVRNIPQPIEEVELPF